MRNESRPQLSTFEQKIMRDYLPDGANDNQILEAIEKLEDKAIRLPANIRRSYQVVIDLLRDELHGL
jgi:hypothetical protein